MYIFNAMYTSPSIERQALNRVGTLIEVPFRFDSFQSGKHSRPIRHHRTRQKNTLDQHLHTYNVHKKSWLGAPLLHRSSTRCYLRPAFQFSMQLFTFWSFVMLCQVGRNCICSGHAATMINSSLGCPACKSDYGQRLNTSFLGTCIFLLLLLADWLLVDYDVNG